MSTVFAVHHHATRVFTAQQMRDFDKAAVEDYGIPSIVLMENAALCVVEFLEMKFAPLQGKRAVVLCGKGNNGGDGFAIARHLETRGCRCEVRFAGSSVEAIEGDAKINFEILNREHEVSQKWYRNTHPYNYGESISKISRGFISDYHFDFAVDALLGTGLRTEQQDEPTTSSQLDSSIMGRAMLDLTENGKTPLVAVDIPSGLIADTGQSTGHTPNADYTITFVGPKRGMFVHGGQKHCGEIWVGDIGTPRRHLQITETGCYCINRSFARDLLPHRSIDAHKGTAGRVVICGGSYGMSGAPTLAAKASLRVGAGLCIACLPDKALPMFASAFAEATSHPLPCDDEGHLVESAADAVIEYSINADVLAIGPGLSRSQGALDFARRVVCESPLPIVVDADALYALRAIEEKVKARQAATILTPHPGEMGELMQMSVEEVQNNRIEVALACAQKFNAIVVLKGPRSIVAIPNFRNCNDETSDVTFINLTGNPGMATGGSGDVLTGTIAGLLAQIKDAQSATLLGVYLHGLAGDLEYSIKGNGLIAGDIADALPRALLDLQKPDEPSSNPRLRKLE